VAIAAEARVATMGKTAVASENASGMATRIGAPSKPIWSRRPDRTPVQNAFKHWKDHGKEFNGTQNNMLKMHGNFGIE
jgi:pyocin large subunit-like protein